MTAIVILVLGNAVVGALMGPIYGLQKAVSTYLGARSYWLFRELIDFSFTLLGLSSAAFAIYTMPAENGVWANLSDYTRTALGFGPLLVGGYLMFSVCDHFFAQARGRQGIAESRN